MLTCATPLVVSGCSPTFGASSGAADGAGYSLLNPNSGTRSYIIANDKPFAKEVAGHNATCKQHKACKKD
jgi:hypothetical protein